LTAVTLMTPSTVAKARATSKWGGGSGADTAHAEKAEGASMIAALGDDALYTGTQCGKDEPGSVEMQGDSGVDTFATLDDGTVGTGTVDVIADFDETEGDVIDISDVVSETPDLTLVNDDGDAILMDGGIALVRLENFSLGDHADLETLLANGSISAHPPPKINDD
jgi:hypothetical protein